MIYNSHLLWNLYFIIKLLWFIQIIAGQQSIVTRAKIFLDLNTVVLPKFSDSCSTTNCFKYGISVIVLMIACGFLVEHTSLNFNESSMDNFFSEDTVNDVIAFFFTLTFLFLLALLSVLYECSYVAGGIVWISFSFGETLSSY